MPRPGVPLACALACLAAGATPASDRAPGAEAGRRLYREGLLSSGEAVTAVVQGDVPVLGTQVTCAACHRRSGMGAIESGRVVPAVAGPLLLSRGAQPARPPYSLESFGRAVREGVDPSGRKLDALMPRFRVPDSDLAALFEHLRSLGASPPPGLDASSLRLATVVAGDVPPERERAVTDVLSTFFALRNRGAPQRRRGGHAPGRPKEEFRAWSLDVWRVRGAASTWREQLEARQSERPVFALVGGIGAGAWEPVHDFCEAQEMPCLLPVVDAPPADDGAHYSFYFSRGLRLEAEIVATRLARDAPDGVVVQVVGESEGAAPAAAALAKALDRRGARARSVPLGDAGEALRGGESPGVLWLTPVELRGLLADGVLARGSPRPLILSSTLLGGEWTDLPAGVLERGTVVHLSTLPGEADPSLDRFRAWARARGVPAGDEKVQALAYFAALAFSDAAKHMAGYVQRDYLVDLLDHSSALTAYLPAHSRGAIVPGQRVLSRGGWLIDLPGRRAPEWVVPD